MKYREGINFRVFEYSTEKRYLNAFEDSLNLFYQGQNDCKMSKKLEKLHNVLQPYHSLGFTQLNKTRLNSHLMNPLRFQFVNKV